MRIKTALPMALLSSLIGFGATAHAQVQRPPQYILISFDGSYTSSMWKATREHALETGAEVTHFISGVDFLKGSSSRKIEGATDSIYIPPRHKKGQRRSDIGFGGNHEEVATRINEMKKSMDAGMEIGGHANAHFDGTKWSADEWIYEFDLFHKFVYNVFNINGIKESEAGVRERDWKSSLSMGHLKSFRAPYLGRGKGLWQAMGKSSWTIDGQKTGAMRYDASDVSNSPTAWPSKSDYGFWYMRMATIPVPGKSRPVLSMDYNFYASDSDNAAAPKDKPALVGKFEEQMYGAYVNWFNRNYFGNRAPINIGHHFSTWNKAAYWNALKRFMTNVCLKPEVRCITGAEMADILDNTSASTLAAYRDGNFSRGGTPQISIPLASRVSMDAPAAQAYQLQNNNIASLPKFEGLTFEWRAESKTLNTSDINLAQLAAKGVSRVDLVSRDQDGREIATAYMIDWTPSNNQAKLRRWLEPDVVACDAQAHEEKVDVSALNGEIQI